MRDYRKISEKIKNYNKLKKELKGLSAEALQNSKKEKYSHFLNIEHSLKNQIFDGGELLKIADDIYSEYSSKDQCIEEEKGKLEDTLKKLLVIINGKNGAIVDEFKKIIDEYKIGTTYDQNF